MKFQCLSVANKYYINGSWCLLWELTNGSRARFRRFLAYGIKYLEFGDPQCGGKFLQCTEEILSVGGNFCSEQKRSSVWGKISTV